MSLELNLFKSKIAVSERWFKLYRRIHNLFLSKEFIHIEDYKLMFNQLNTRIDNLNQKLDANLNNIAVTFGTHVHVAPQAPGGAIPTMPPGSPLTVDVTPNPPVPYVDAAMVAADATWAGLGPASAPLGTGTSRAAQEASLTASSQIAAEG